VANAGAPALNATLATKLTALETAVTTAGGTFEINTTEMGGQTLVFQQHLFSIRQAYISLDALPTVGSVVIAGRPQLTAPPGFPCQTLIDEVNLEIIVHTLFPFTPDNAPWAHDPVLANPTAAKHRTGDAFDMRINGLPPATIDALATGAGLIRPNPVTEPDHFEQ